MDRITLIRGKIIAALKDYTFSGTKIPVFDEIVNPSTTLPTINNAQVYIILQDQQQIYDPIQTYCAPRFNINLTIKIVTIFGLVGNKKLSEDIGFEVLNLLRDDRNNSKLDGVDSIELSVSRSSNEVSATRTAYSKIFILNFIVNN